MVDYEGMGRRIKARRRLKKMSQEQMAQAVRISVSFYGNIERGRRIPSIDTLVAIANALDVGVDYLLADSLEAVDKKRTQFEARTVYQYLREKIEELQYDDVLQPDD